MVRLLSVEDDKDLQRLLALALPSKEYEVHFAFTGPEGFQAAMTLKPDIILCDLMLPGYGGQELIRKLRAEPGTRETPIVVVTAYYDTATLVEMEIRKLGIIEYMRKPVMHGELLKLLRQISETISQRTKAK